MKKVLLCLCIFLLSLIAFTACDLPQNAVLSESDEAKKEADKKKEKVATPFWGQAWFSGDAEYMFIEADGQKYIRYLPDSLNDSLYLQVKLEDTENHFINAVVKYSKDSIREMGTPVRFTYVSEDNKLTIKADDSNTAKFKTIFTASDMAKFDGVEVRKFNIPAVETVYLSNLDGNYTLKDLGWKLQIKSKVCIEKDVNHSWFAHAVDVKEANGIYEFLLCHDSNADTGITGDSSKEPFINSQATVWSYMKLYSKPDSTETTVVEWSSQWYSSPYEVLNSDLDMKDSFEYSIPEIKYVYSFYFANPGTDAKGCCCVDKNTDIGLLKKIEFTSHIPVTKTWKEILEEANETEMLEKLPEGKTKDYWWYSTDSITSIESSYVYKLSDTTEPSLKEYEFYCALKDKPVAGAVYYQEGHFKHATKDWDLTVTSTGITYNDKSYTYIAGATWSTASDGTSPLRCCYLITDGEKNYFCAIFWYTNNGKTYINFNEPKETELTAVFPTSADADKYVTNLANDGKNHYASDLLGNSKSNLIKQ